MKIVFLVHTVAARAAHDIYTTKGLSTPQEYEAASYVSGGTPGFLPLARYNWHSKEQVRGLAPRQERSQWTPPELSLMEGVHNDIPLKFVQSVLGLAGTAMEKTLKETAMGRGLLQHLYRKLREESIEGEEGGTYFFKLHPTIWEV